jgi:hypothetical protein
MAKSFMQRQDERNKKRGRRSQLQGLPGHQSYKGTLIGDVEDTVMGRASNLPDVKRPKAADLDPLRPSRRGRGPSGSENMPAIISPEGGKITQEHTLGTIPHHKRLEDIPVRRRGR